MWQSLLTEGARRLADRGLLICVCELIFVVGIRELEASTTHGKSTSCNHPGSVDFPSSFSFRSQLVGRRNNSTRTRFDYQLAWYFSHRYCSSWVRAEKQILKTTHSLLSAYHAVSSTFSPFLNTSLFIIVLVTIAVTSNG